MNYWEDKVDRNAPKLTRGLIRRALAAIADLERAKYAEYFRAQCSACGKQKQPEQVKGAHGTPFKFPTLCDKCMRVLPRELRSEIVAKSDMLYPCRSKALADAIDYIRANPPVVKTTRRRKAVAA